MNDIVSAINKEITNLLLDYSETILPIEDSIVDGVYTRIMYAKAGNVVVGCTHKKGGTAVLLSGTIRIIDGDEKYEINAPYIYNTVAGTQKLGLALNDCVFVTMHSVEATTTEEAEKELFVETPQITRIRNSFKTLMLENKQDNNEISNNESLIVQYEYSDNYIIDKSLIDGLGVKAKKDFQRNEIISLIKQKSNTPLIRYINHSDIPNAKFEDLENGDIILKAMVFIPQGYEIFVNYRERNIK